LTELYDGRGSGSRAVPPPRATPWIAVATVAILAGMGTATLGGPAEADAGRVVAAAAPVRAISPKMVELTFNPRVARGLKVAKVAFRFTLEHGAGVRDAVRARVDERWELMVSTALRTLKRRGPDELKQDGGLDAIEADLRRAIDGTLFPDGLARCCEILWEQILVQ
jgi:flagellar basal body-associated protein FliL